MHQDGSLYRNTLHYTTPNNLQQQQQQHYIQQPQLHNSLSSFHWRTTTTFWTRFGLWFEPHPWPSSKKRQEFDNSNTKFGPSSTMVLNIIPCLGLDERIESRYLTYSLSNYAHYTNNADITIPGSIKPIRVFFFIILSLFWSFLNPVILVFFKYDWIVAISIIFSIAYQYSSHYICTFLYCILSIQQFNLQWAIHYAQYLLEHSSVLMGDVLISMHRLVL